MKKWFVMKSDGETSGGLFDTEEHAKKHLDLARQIFPEVAHEYRIVSGQVTFDDEKQGDESNERAQSSD